jgi:hypothetical protein
MMSLILPHTWMTMGISVLGSLLHDNKAP